MEAKHTESATELATLLQLYRDINARIEALAPRVYSCFVPDDAPAGPPCGWFADMASDATCPGRPANLRCTTGEPTLRIAAGSSVR